ncbi:MAG: hypothetical protein PW843_07465 [Azospirillaceae bacterium]|nr:hypothetical protein [Azospirillaceae bacterium]
MSGRHHRRRHRHHNGGTFRQVWAWPVALGVLTVFGLLSALLGEHGVWWVLSWVTLAAPLVVIVASLLRARRAAAVGRT